MIVGLAHTPFPTPTAIAVGVFCVSEQSALVSPAATAPLINLNLSYSRIPDWSMSDFDNERPAAYCQSNDRRRL